MLVFETESNKALESADEDNSSEQLSTSVSVGDNRTFVLNWISGLWHRGTIHTEDNYVADFYPVFSIMPKTKHKRV